MPYLDMGLNQVKVTPLVGRSVPLCNAVCTAAEQVIVQCPEEEDRAPHMYSLLSTLLISKWERLRFVRQLQARNMSFIFVTFSVMKLERSRLVRLLQPANIPLIYDTFLVMK